MKKAKPPRVRTQVSATSGCPNCGIALALVQETRALLEEERSRGDKIREELEALLSARVVQASALPVAEDPRLGPRPVAPAENAAMRRAVSMPIDMASRIAAMEVERGRQIPARGPAPAPFEEPLDPAAEEAASTEALDTLVGAIDAARQTKELGEEIPEVPPAAAAAAEK